MGGRTDERCLAAFVLAKGIFRTGVSGQKRNFSQSMLNNLFQLERDENK